MWEIREAGRLDEMSQGKLSLRIEIHPDGDIVICVDEDGMPLQDENGTLAKVEFCSLAGGGGRSAHTRTALLQLFNAFLKDNEEHPEGIPPFPINLKKKMEKEKQTPDM